MYNIIYATKGLFRNFINFKGRLSRAGYWWAYLGYLILSVIVSIVAAVTDADWITTIFSLVFFLPLLSAAVRRFHDTGRSGVQILVLYLLYGVFVGVMVFSLFSSIFTGIAGAAELTIFGLISIFVSFIGIIAVGIYELVILASRGSAGENKYGLPRPFAMNYHV